MAKRKIRLFLIGSFSPEVRERFISECFRYGSRTVMFTTTEKDADLAVNLTDLNGTTDIRAEAMFTVSTAKKAQKIKKNVSTLKRLQNGSTKRNG